jgi:DNA-binding MarR family transcriptional regulator
MSKAANVPFATTLHIRDHCLCLYLQRAARRAARIFDEALRPLGLTNGQFSLLNALNRPEPARMAPVATLLAMDRTTLTAALKPLERRGLAAVAPDPADRRGRVLSLTPAGRALLAEALPIWEATHAALEGRLPAGAPDRLRRDLGVLSAADPESAPPTRRRQRSSPISAKSR